MWFLLGCVGTLATPDGEERLRGALWIDEPFGAGDPSAMILGANSPIPCEAEDTADDPLTPEDEAAGAAIWWQAQLTAAATREGAVLLGTWLPDASPGGRWDLGSGAENAGSAWGWRVVEAELAERDGEFYIYDVVESSFEVDLSGTLHATVDDDSAEVSLDLGGWATEGRFSRCRNTVLATFALQLAATLGVEDGGSPGD